MIKFGYIAGYNSYNEIRFADVNTRDNYFDDKVTYTVDAYYPPYYTNVIKIDKSDVPQTTPINFVILVNNNKYYYYFVDHFNYINEDIYEIVINMDTVLTHMFDFVVTQGTATRKSISRWITKNNILQINREYIRENVSEGYMEVSELTYKEPNKYLIVCSSHNYVDANTDSGHYTDTGVKYEFGYYVYVFPIAPFNISEAATVAINNYGTLVQNAMYGNQVEKFVVDPYTINMMIVESEYLDSIFHTQWTYTDLYHATLDMQYDVGLTSLEIVRYGSGNPYQCGFNIINLDVNAETYSSYAFGFTRNLVGLREF